MQKNMLNEKLLWLKKVYEEGKISVECYNSTVRILEEQLISIEKKEIEENLKTIIKKNPTAGVLDGRLYIKLTCPSCSTQGANYNDKNLFKYLGKDGRGHLYFKCPNCGKHIKYETLTGKIISKSRILNIFTAFFK